MRKFLIIAGVATFSTAILSCTGAKGDYPGDAYAPDMYYSRAYETYGYNSNDSYNSLKERGINYNSMPVPGTIARGETQNYHLTADSAGILAAETLVSPFDTVTASKSVLDEGERLYLVNCGICHGAKQIHGTLPFGPRIHPWAWHQRGMQSSPTLSPAA